MDIQSITEKTFYTLRRLKKHEVSPMYVAKVVSKKVYNRTIRKIKRSIKSITADKYTKFARNKNYFLKNYLLENHPKDLNKLFKAVDISKAKGIVIYPHAVHWEPLQRPQHFMRELGEMGYVCFFCDSDQNKKFTIEEKFKNVFVVNKEEVLVEAFRNYYVIMYMTWFGQNQIARLFKNKFVWYDLVDNSEFFALGKEKTAKILHKKLILNSDLVSYSSNGLKPEGRQDALFAPNGVDTKLFSLNSNATKRSGVVYIGAIENKWFNWEGLIYAANNLKDTKFTIIGKPPKKHPKLPSNVELPGFVDQTEIPKYLRKAKVGIIPFIRNEITEDVLPLKMFEYCMMGLPTVSTGLKELSELSQDFIMNTYDKKSFLKNLQKALNTKYDRKEFVSFAQEYDWKKCLADISEKFTSSLKGIKVYANVKTEKSINVVTPTFYSFEGDNYFSGGAERYLVDLAEVTKSLGYKLRIFQKGTYNWLRMYDDKIEVCALPNDKGEEDWGYSTEFNKKFYSLTQGRSLLNIYSPFPLSLPHISSPSVGISHGIYWDDGAYNGRLDDVFVEAAKDLDKFISVDTNTCNWFQTRDLDIGNKMEYVPNYVDNEEFKPDENKNSDPIIILYPRRLYRARGFYIVLDVLDEILERYKNVEFHFVGKGIDKDIDKLKPYMKKWKSRVQWYWEDQSEMSKVYKKATISLIPTLHSEGTSLSCLEAMSSGNIVIATRVGGLTDLVINRFNGFLIEPNSESLKKSLEYVLNNLDECEIIRKRGIESAKAFNKKLWSERWREIIKENIEKVDSKRFKETQIVKLSYKNKKELEKNLKKIGEELIEGNVVFVNVRSGEITKKESFGRLQFLPLKDS